MMFFLNLTSAKPYSFFVICFAAFQLFTISEIKAQTLTTPSIPYQEVNTGSLYFKNQDGYFPTLTQNSDYQVTVNGLLARVNFTQTFKNTTADFLEAVYVFPLIDDAAVDAMIMEVGDRRIVGKIKEKQQAQKMYTKAKREGKKTSLVSQQRPNIFTSKLANIAPGETIKISLSYLQSIVLKDEVFSLRIPLTLTPRYIPPPRKFVDQESEQLNSSNEPVITNINSHGWAIANNRVLDAHEITPLQTRISSGDMKTQTTTIQINLNTGLPVTGVESLYHRIIKQTANQNMSNNAHTNNQKNRALSVSLADDKILLDQDFVLQWQLAQGDVPKAAFFSESISGQDMENFDYGLLMVMPPKQLQMKAITKEVIYILDTSGSMGGVAIRQAKQALSTALDLLNINDSFNVIAFNDDLENLFTDSKIANHNNVERAKQWISTIDAGGGTNMYPAIKKALQKGVLNKAYRQVIFITDGSVGNEDELLTLIDSDLADTRLHTVGIGSAPNGYFMSQAASVGRGTYRYIGSINEVASQMNRLFEQISKPLMQNIVVQWPVDSAEMFPQKLPDLYATEPLLISVRWPKHENNQKNQVIKIAGQLATSVWQEQVIITKRDNQKIKSENQNLNNGVAPWWARQKITHLTSVLRRSNSVEQTNELKSQITALALSHHLVSPYTSFIAIEESVSRNQDQSLTSKGVKNLMPKGSSQMVPLANTALGLTGYVYLALLFFTLALVMQLVTKRSMFKSS